MASRGANFCRLLLALSTAVGVLTGRSAQGCDDAQHGGADALVASTAGASDGPAARLADRRSVGRPSSTLIDLVWATADATIITARDQSSLRPDAMRGAAPRALAHTRAFLCQLLI